MYAAGRAAAVRAARERLHIVGVVDVRSGGRDDGGSTPTAKPLDAPAPNEVDAAGAHGPAEKPVHDADPDRPQHCPREKN